jgi:histone demethylase JARID1
MCKNKSESVKVRYAADLPFKQFLSKSEVDEIHKKLEENHLWNFLTLYLRDKSLFRFLKENQTAHLSGLTIPWMYFGMLYATFCWHVEDLYLYSVNYMHYGQPKIWYGIPHNEKEKMDNYIKREISHRKINDENIVHKLILLIDPEDLIKHGINVYKAVQYPGELILTLPKAYHCGFSSGFNISEAVNLAVILE